MKLRHANQLPAWFDLHKYRFLRDLRADGWLAVVAWLLAMDHDLRAGWPAVFEDERPDDVFGTFGPHLSSFLAGARTPLRYSTYAARLRWPGIRALTPAAGAGSAAMRFQYARNSPTDNARSPGCAFPSIVARSRAGFVVILRERNSGGARAS